MFFPEGWGPKERKAKPRRAAKRRPARRPQGEAATPRAPSSRPRPARKRQPRASKPPRGVGVDRVVLGKRDFAAVQAAAGWPGILPDREKRVTRVRGKAYWPGIALEHEASAFELCPAEDHVGPTTTEVLGRFEGQPGYLFRSGGRDYVVLRPVTFVLEGGALD